MQDHSLNAIEQEAIALVKQEKEAWEDAVAFVTPKVAFNIRNLIQRCRKNYYGVFDEETDPVTGAKKTWVPLTESLVDAAVKNIDLDTKDINLRAKKPSAIGLTAFVRHIVRTRLDQVGFGDLMDRMERNLAIDGTAVWKTYRTNDKKKAARVSQVDLLNFYIDPTAESIQDTPAVLERAVITPKQVAAMDGWANTDDLETRNYSRNDQDFNGHQQGGEYVEVFERWGLMSKHLITGNDKDRDEIVEGHIVVSGLDGEARVHLIEENDTTDASGRVVKPYEECWYKRVPGRWHGRGVAEMVLMIQTWVNTIVNVRITRNRISQMGLFKIRKGSGVTPQMLARLPVNGAVVVNNPDDLVQMAVQDASPSSYNDENVATGWAERVTSAFEAITGEQLPSSTTATSAVIQNRMAQSQFVMIKEGIGMFLQRWLETHFIPAVAKTITKGELERITGDTAEMSNMDEKIANGLIMQRLEELAAENKVVSRADAAAERQRILDKLKARGPDRFVEVMSKPDMLDYEVQVFVTNEEIDKSVTVQNLISVLQTVAQVPGIDIDPGQVARSIFDLMGLDTRQFESKQLQAPQPTPQIQAAPQAPQEPVGPEEAQTDQILTTTANTL